MMRRASRWLVGTLVSASLLMIPASAGACLTLTFDAWSNGDGTVTYQLTGTDEADRYLFSVGGAPVGDVAQAGGQSVTRVFDAPGGVAPKVTVELWNSREQDPGSDYRGWEKRTPEVNMVDTSSPAASSSSGRTPTETGTAHPSGPVPGG